MPQRGLRKGEHLVESRKLLPVTVSMACWLDLLGYGAMLNRASFDPYHPIAKRAIEPLRAFQEVVANNSLAAFPTLVINDGAVAYADVGIDARDKVSAFVERSWILFEAASATDIAGGVGGIRAVVAAGLRAKGSRRGFMKQDADYAAIIRSLASAAIDERAALAAMRKVRRVHDIVPQLQANFAFSRAYTAEASGKKGGIGGARFFLDRSVLAGEAPAWMTVSDPIPWEPGAQIASLATSFHAVEAMDPLPEGAERAFRTGRELYERLRHDMTGTA